MMQYPRRFKCLWKTSSNIYKLQELNRTFLNRLYFVNNACTETVLKSNGPCVRRVPCVRYMLAHNAYPSNLLLPTKCINYQSSFGWNHSCFRFRYSFREFNAISILGLGLSGILLGGRPVYTLLGVTLLASRTDLASLGVTGLEWGIRP